MSALNLWQAMSKLLTVFFCTYGHIINLHTARHRLELPALRHGIAKIRGISSVFTMPGA